MAMPDREKVISGLEHCIPDPNKSLHERTEENERRHAECPYGGKEYEHGMGCFWDLMSDARALLKEQQAVKPVRDEQMGRMWLCGECGSYVGLEDDVPYVPNEYDKYCRECGRPVLWEAVGRSVK